MTERCEGKKNGMDVNPDSCLEKASDSYTKDTLNSPTENTCQESDKNNCMEDVKNSHTEDGKNSHKEDGKNSHTEDGKNSRMEDGKNSCTEDGKNSCMEDGKNSCMEDGKNSHVEDGKNKCAVRCRSCGSLVLSERSASYLQEKHPLPTPTQPRHTPSPTTHDVSEWWMVEDMFTFDNIGFSHTVGSVKYLVCADCEHGPLGWHNTVTRHSYVAIQRVNNGP